MTLITSDTPTIIPELKAQDICDLLNGHDWDDWTYKLVCTYDNQAYITVYDEDGEFLGPI